jgi:hypothetical protein
MKGMIVALVVLLLAACSKSPNPAPPQTDTTHTGSHDTIPKPPDSSHHDSIPTPPTEKPGVTKIGGTLTWGVNFNKGQVQIMEGGVDNTVELVDYDTAHCSAEIINAYKGSCTIKYYSLNSDTTVAFIFSNQDYWSGEADWKNPDTAGIVQIHVYRKDGKNIKSGVKDIYMPLGRVPADVSGQGQMTINSYKGIRAKLTLDSLVKFIGSRSTMTLQQSSGF